MYIRGPCHGAILSSDQGVIFRSQIIPSPEWVPGIELRSGLKMLQASSLLSHYH